MEKYCFHCNNGKLMICGSLVVVQKENMKANDTAQKEMATQTTAERNQMISKSNLGEQMAKRGNDSAQQGI